MYKRLNLIAATLVVALLASACGLQMVIGSGVIAAETRAVSNFTGVTLAGIGDVVLTQGETYSLRIEAEDNLIPYFETSVQDSTLKIGVKPQFLGIGLHPTRPVKFYVTLPSLASVTLAGSGNILAGSFQAQSVKIGLLGSGNISMEGLTATDVGISLAGSGDVVVAGLVAESISSTISGSGDITLAGEVSEQSARVVGSGDYQGQDLHSKSAAVRISGSGDCSVWASDTLDITVIGSGDVVYAGDPRVNSTISGSGGIHSTD